MLLLLLGACDHSAPFTTPDYTLDEPLIDGDPARLTYGGSRDPAWTPDGGGIAVTFSDHARDDHDGCLAILPVTGGTIRNMTCHEGPLARDTVDVLSLPALAEDGRVAYLRASRPPAAQFVREQVLAVAPWGDLAAATRLRFVPFPSPGGVHLVSLSTPRWMGTDRLAFVGIGETIILPCDECQPIVVRSGRELIVADFSGTTPQFTAVATAGNPLSVAVDGDEMYYTLAGDARVYRQTGVSGAPSVAHEFVGHTVVRDIDVVNGRLAAIVDGLAAAWLGSATVYTDTPDGIVVDAGPGDLYLVDLATGTEQLLARTGFRFKAPALAPAGDAIAVMALPVEQLGDNSWVVNGASEIWRFGRP
jgi:hypothetical protein